MAQISIYNRVDKYMSCIVLSYRSTFNNCCYSIRSNNFVRKQLEVAITASQLLTKVPFL